MLFILVSKLSNHSNHLFLYSQPHDWRTIGCWLVWGAEFITLSLTKGFPSSQKTICEVFLLVNLQTNTVTVDCGPPVSVYLKMFSLTLAQIHTNTSEHSRLRLRQGTWKRCGGENTNSVKERTLPITWKVVRKREWFRLGHKIKHYCVLETHLVCKGIEERWGQSEVYSCKVVEFRESVVETASLEVWKEQKREGKYNRNTPEKWNEGVYRFITIQSWEHLSKEGVGPKQTKRQCVFYGTVF